MINLDNFNQIKTLITQKFSNKKGFTDEVINSITSTYIYFEKNYPNEIPLDQIPDIATFAHVKNNTGLTIGKIYLNRILNNVQEFVHDYSPDNCSEFVALDKKVYVPKKDNQEWINRLNNWNINNLTDEQKQILKQKIRAKVITHELIHAASFNGQNIGFVYSSLGQQIDNKKIQELTEKYQSNYFNLIYGINLEEMITEILALNIVENHTIQNIKVTNKNSFEIPVRNIDSSNNILNPFAEYILKSYPEIVNYKFTDGLKFLADFNNNNEMGFSSGAQITYQIFAEACYKIKNDKNNSINKLVTFQHGCLNKYKKHITLNNVEDLKKCLTDIETFKLFAVKENGKIEEHLLININEIENIVKEKANSLEIPFNDYASLSVNINNELIDKSKELNLPYYSYTSVNNSILTN